MAVDRRDEKETPKNDRTDLEVWLRVKGPELLKRQAANIVLGLALLIALGMFLYSRSRNKAIEADNVQQNAAAAYDLSLQLRHLPAASRLGTDASASERQQRAREALNAADVVLTSDEAKPAQKAIAQLVKADVAWTLANLPEGALATTRPVSNFTVKTSAEYLDDAEAGYTDVLRNYTDQKEAAAAALLGLAAVAENRGKFDDAGKWYQNVIDDTTLRETYREIAGSRKAMLADLAKPYVLATTQPSATRPSADAGVPELLARPPEPTTVPASTRPTASAPAPTTQR